MLDSVRRGLRDEHAERPWRQIQHYTASLHSDRATESVADLEPPHLTRDYSAARFPGVTLAVPADNLAMAGATVVLSRVPLARIAMSQTPVLIANSSAVFALESITDAWATEPASFPLWLISCDENNVALAKSDETAFTERDSIENQAESLESMILAVPSSIREPYADRLAKRLMDLLTAGKEDDLEPGMSRGSLKWFLAFLRANVGLDCPLLALTPEGNLYATWKRGRDRVFSAHFMPSGEVRFVVFTPTPGHRKSITRLTGTTLAAALLNTVEPHGVMSWARSEKRRHPRR